MYKRIILIFSILFIFSRNTINAQPDSVKIGIYVYSLHDINYHNKEYTIRFWTWLIHQNKNFNFKEETEIPNAKSLEKPDVMEFKSNDKIWSLMKMKAIMKQSWDVEDYPFDNQLLSVKIENTLYDKNGLLFIPDHNGSTFDSIMTVDGWFIKKFSVDTGTTDYKTAFGDPNAIVQKSKYSNFSINILLERDAWGLFFKIFIGMYIAFLISSVSFFIDTDEIEPKFGLPVGGLFAAVGNKYIIDSILPETSSFTLVDTLHTLTFFFIFITIAFSAYTYIKVDKNKKKKKISGEDNSKKELHDYAVNYNKRGGIVIVTIYSILNLILVTIALF